MGHMCKLHKPQESNGFRSNEEARNLCMSTLKEQSHKVP